MGAPGLDRDLALGAGGPRILFVALANDIGTDRLPAALGAIGAECAILCPPDFYCAGARAIRHRFPLPSHRGLWLGIPFLRRRLEAASRKWDAEIVVPLDNVAAHCLRATATSEKTTPHLRQLLQRSFGSPSGYHPVCSRSGLMRFADSLGIHMPRFCVSTDAAVLRDHAETWGYPVVLKAENTCGGHGVSIAGTADELKAALAGRARGSIGRRLRRSIGKSLWRLAGLRETTSAPALLQSFAPGVPAMRTVCTWQGQVLDGASFLAEQVHPAPTGPSTIVRFVENNEMADTARRLVEALGCSGFISFDFMLDETTGRAALIEANPRPIGTTHLGRLFGHDLGAPLLARLTGKRPIAVRTPASAPSLVALFPKEIEREPRQLWRLRADGIFHDVPLDEPAVVALYLQRLARLHPDEIGAIADAIGADGVEPRVAVERRQRARPPSAFWGAFARHP